MNQQYLFAASLQAAEVPNLPCEYLKNPFGIDVAKPRVSWIIKEGAEGGDQRSQKGVRQAAYQVLVASSPELLTKDQGDLWDSGEVESDQSIQVKYAGKPLTSRRHCQWKVRVWLASRGLGEGWSAPAHSVINQSYAKPIPALCPDGRCPAVRGPE